jgi:hypothetical protein
MSDDENDNKITLDIKEGFALAGTQAETRRATRIRNRWARVRQDILKEWCETQVVQGLTEDDAARLYYKMSGDAPIRRRWATCTYDELVKWLRERGEEPLAGLSGQARRFFNASMFAAVRIKGKSIAVYMGTPPPEHDGGIYDPGPDDPWTQNLIAVWVGEGSPTEEPEDL